MSTLPRTLRNLWKIGFREYFQQLQTVGDTKAGTLVGIDRYGNKYFQNDEEELPLRTRWIEYKERKDYDPSQIEPGWHAWISHMNDNPPNTTVIPGTGHAKWGLPEHRENPTQSRKAYKPYPTTISKYAAWEPKVKERA